MFAVYQSLQNDFYVLTANVQAYACVTFKVKTFLR